MEVQIHKTMKAAANKFKFLDLVVYGSGIFGSDWVGSWSDPFNSIGVEPFSNEPSKTLMPAPDADGAALKDPWRMTRMIRLIDRNFAGPTCRVFCPRFYEGWKVQQGLCTRPLKVCGRHFIV